jgi:hypothetical protein
MKPELSGAPLSLLSLARDSAGDSAVISGHQPLSAAGALSSSVFMSKSSRLYLSAVIRA